MTIPFTIDAPPKPRKVTVRIGVDPDENLAARVRLKLILNQAELAALIGCSHATITRIELGAPPTPLQTRRLLALLTRRERLTWMKIPHRYR